MYINGFSIARTTYDTVQYNGKSIIEQLFYPKSKTNFHLCERAEPPISETLKTSKKNSCTSTKTHLSYDFVSSDTTIKNHPIITHSTQLICCQQNQPEKIFPKLQFQ